jgi:hypothetical protein
LSGTTQQLASADVNHDGLPDIVEVRSGALPGGPHLTIRINAGTADRFPTASTYAVPLNSLSPTSIALGDLDGDGYADLALGTYTSNSTPEGSVNDSLYVFRNSGRDGLWFFDPVRVAKSGGSGACTAAIRIGDVDGDGRPDLVTSSSCAGATRTVEYYKNSGVIADFAHLQPTSFSSGLESTDVILADLHASGQLDLIVAGTDGSGAGSVVQLSSYVPPSPPVQAPPPPAPTGSSGGSSSSTSSSSSSSSGSSSSSSSASASTTGGGGALQVWELAALGLILVCKATTITPRGNGGRGLRKWQPSRRS